MDFATTDLRASACNVFFLDRLGIPFAGLYQDPDQPLVLFQQALQELKRIAGSGEPCGGVLAKDLSSDEGNMMKPILPGRYYLYRSTKFGRAVKQTAVLKAVAPVAACPQSQFQGMHIGNSLILASFRKEPKQCRLRIRRYAISGQGRPSKWSKSTTVSGLFDYPIVPSEMLEDIPHKGLPWDETDELTSRNWIPMLSGLYGFFARGQIDIHPDTLVIRCFSPSKLIRSYHGRVASLKDTSLVYRKILGMHYQQCVYVSITAHGVPMRPLILDDWHLNTTEEFLDSDKTLGSTGSISNDYCTQSCLLSLSDFEGGWPLDPNCPNLEKHQASQMNSDETDAEEGKHRLCADDLILLLRDQLSHDQSEYCEQPRASTQGQHGPFFKLTQASLGCTLVGKGVRAAEQHKLANEAKVYEAMSSLQGECVPVCLGVIALQVPCGEHADTMEDITQMLLLSHAGIAVEHEDGEEPDLPVDDDEVAMEANRTFDEINACGVKRSDKRKKHQFWNEQRDRVFFTDFEKDSLRRR